MPAISASAPGKIILFGEHAVVYGQPAIAIPVNQVNAHAVVIARPTAPKGEILVDSPDIHLLSPIQDLPEQHPFKILLGIIQTHLQLDAFPAFHLRISSTIPIAGGMGSGAAIAVAVIRAVTTFLNRPLDQEMVNQLAFESEKIFHGTPSGVDNTVITFDQPIFFQREQPFQKLSPNFPMTFVIADSGQSSSTAEMVSGVRQRLQQNAELAETILDQFGKITLRARNILESESPSGLGELMLQNHQLLQRIGVSTPKLDYLVGEALYAGAKGAKLSGAGGGGNMIALVEKTSAEAIAGRLITAGAVRTIITDLIPK